MKKYILCCLCLFMFGCKNIYTNISLINSRSPSINTAGTNSTQAATGYEGGGSLSTQIPVQ